MSTQPEEYAVNHHYARGDLEAVLLAALQAAGKRVDDLHPDDLAPVDHFHTGGKAATLDLLRLAGLQAGMEVLDVGGGLGGAARLLAGEHVRRVTVLDLTAEYCRVGARLTAYTGLSDRVTFQVGTATAMPFPAAHFDAVWTQHSSMNIADKARLFAEIHRVLRPHGRLALYEIMAGPVQPLHFPVPWAHDGSINFLLPPEAIRSLLIQMGFREVAWVDARAAAIEWFRARLPAAGQPAPALGLHVLLGPAFGEMVRNQLRNLEEERTTVIQAVFERD